MITTKNIKMVLDLPTSDDKIVEELKSRGIEPLRWAVTAVSDNELWVNVSYEE